MITKPQPRFQGGKDALSKSKLVSLLNDAGYTPEEMVAMGPKFVKDRIIPEALVLGHCRNSVADFTKNPNKAANARDTAARIGFAVPIKTNFQVVYPRREEFKKAINKKVAVVQNSDAASNMNIAEFLKIVNRIANREQQKLKTLKSNYSDFEREDFIWHYLLESFSTMGRSRGREGLIVNKENYNQLKFEFLELLKDSEILGHIKSICWKAKIRMPDKKAEFILGCFKQYKQLGGHQKAKAMLVAKSGGEEKIKFLKSFTGIGEKYARNIMMDVYHPEFRNFIAIDIRINNILKSWNYDNPSYQEKEEFLLGIAKQANINGWELDRLMYNFEAEFTKQ